MFSRLRPGRWIARSNRRGDAPRGGNRRLRAGVARAHHSRTPRGSLRLSDVGNAGLVITAIERAVTAAMDGDVSGVVTNPLAKSVLKGAGFGFRDIRSSSARSRNAARGEARGQ